MTVANEHEFRNLVIGGDRATMLASCEISPNLRGRSFLRDTDFTPGELLDLLGTAARLKEIRKLGRPHTYLHGKTLGLIFQHPSTRTRAAFQIGMEQLGGQAIFLGTSDLQLKRGETLADTARIMSGYVQAIGIRIASGTSRRSSPSPFRRSSSSHADLSPTGSPSVGWSFRCSIAFPQSHAATLEASP